MKNYFTKISTRLFTSLIMLCCILGVGSVSAQGVANYTFAASSGTYTAITGGTTWQSGATVSTDAISSAITLPFNFTYNYATYSSIFISNNGFIVFGNQAPAAANYTPISQTSNSSTATNGYDGAVAGFGCNLVASAASGAAPSIIYGTSGSDFVIQFTDMARSAVTTDRITFQIRLTQTTNVVSIVYNAATASASTTISPQVGLRGASYRDWKNLTGSTATTWTAPTSQNTAGSAVSTSTMRFTTTAPAAAPAAGQTFTWTPPAALGAPTYASLPATENFDAAPWANGNSTEQLPNATNWRSWPAFGDRSWRRIDATVSSASTGWASATGRPAVAAPASGGAACINNYDGCSGRTGYMDYYVNFSTAGTKTLTFNLISVGGYTLKVYLSTDGGATFTLMGTYNTAVAAWANQTLILGTSTSSTCVVRFEGTTSFGSSGNNIAIDNVSITAAACGPVTASAATSITSSGATANWTGGTGSYIIEYGPTGFTPGTGATAGSGSSTVITASAGATSAAITGLTPNTTYQYYVRQVCSGPTYGNNSSVQSFTTPCLNSSLIVTQGFNAATIPSCWSQQFVSGSLSFTYPSTSTGTPGATPFEGTNLVYYNSFSNSTQTRLVSPPITTTGTSSVDVNFQWYQSTNGGSTLYLTEGVTVQYSLDGTTWNTVGSQIRRYGATTGWTDQTVTLPAGAGNQSTIYVGLLVQGNAGYDSYLDQVIVRPTPSCFQPTALSVTTSSSSTASLSWTAPVSGTPATYSWEVRTSGAGGSGATGLVASGTTSGAVTTASVTGLTANTNYNLYVSTNCTTPSTSSSAWTGPKAFTTPCANQSLTLSEGFNTSGTSVFPTCWSQQYVSGTTNLTFVTTTAGTSPTVSTPFEGTRMVFMNTYSLSTSTRLVSPPITTTGTASVDVNFQWYYSSTGGATSYLTEGVTVQWSTDGTTWNDFTGNFIRRYGATTGWAPIAVTLPAAAGNAPTIYVGFKITGNGGYDTYMDAVSIAPTPTCFPATALTTTALGATTATVAWTAPATGTPATYSWEVRTSGAGGSGATGLVASGTTSGATTSANATGLSANTSYSLYVSTNCTTPTTSSSSWAGPYTFTTPCNPITTFPFTENFNSVTTPAIPSCWTSLDVNGDGDKWITYTTYGTGGSQCAGLYTDFNAGANNDLLILPPMTLNGNQRLTFSVAARSSSEPNDYKVVLSTTGPSPASFTTTLKPLTTVSNTTMTAITPINLSAYTGTVYIAIYVPSGGLDGYYLYVDDVKVDDIPLCQDPTAFNVSGVTATSATLGWTAPTSGGPYARYNWEIGASGFTPGTGASLFSNSPSGSATSDVASGLTPSTTYQAYIQSDCGGGTTGAWIGPISFTTPCLATSLPWSEGFEGIATVGSGVLPSCWSYANVSGTTPSSASGVGTYNEPHSGTQFVWTKWNSNTWLFTPNFDIVAGNTYTFSYWVENKVVTSPVDFNVEVKYGTSNTVAAMTNTLESSYSVTNSGYVQHSITFVAASTGNFTFGIHSTSPSSTPWYLSFDDFSLVQLPNCTGTPTPGTATASLTRMCASNLLPVTLATTGYSAAAQISFQWQSKPAGSGSFTNISGATSSTLTLTPSASTDYQCVVKCGATGLTAATNTVTVRVSSPAITTPASPVTVCGPQTTTLVAGTTAGDTAVWYTSATALDPTFIGNSFTTPTITGPVTYWYSASDNPRSLQTATIPYSPGFTNGTSTGSHGILFTTSAPTTIASVDMYFTGTGTVTIALQDAGGTTIRSVTSVSLTGSGSSAAVTVPLGLDVSAAGNYRLILTGITGTINNLAYNDGTVTFPYTTADGTLSITSGYWYGSDNTVSMYFFRLVVNSSCESTRSSVTVGYTAPPSLTVSPASSIICDGQTVAITATGSAYTTFNWTPTTTITPTTGANVTVSPSNTTDYIVSASGASGGCVNSATARVDVKATPTRFTVTPTNSTICNGTIVKLKASGSLNAIIDTLTKQDFNSGLAGWSIENASYAAASTNFTIQTTPLTASISLSTGFTSYGMTTPFSPFLFSNSDAGGTGSQTRTQLTSLTFPTTGYSSLTLYYQMIYKYWLTSDTVAIQASTDGTSWNTIKNYTASTPNVNTAAHPPLLDSVDMSAYIGFPNVQIRFIYSAAWGYYMGLDNIFVKGVNTAPAYIWTPNSSLYMTSATTAGPIYNGTGRDSVYAVPSTTTTYVATVTNVNTGCQAKDSVKLTVNPRPTADFNSGASSVCIGAIETYTIALTGTAPWTFTLVNGASTRTITTSTSPYVFTDTPTVSKLMKVSALSDANCTAWYQDLDSVNITATNTCTLTWRGTVNNDWHNANNWSPILEPNACTVSVIIPSTTNKPVIGAKNIQVGNITIGNGQTITLNNAKNLSVCQNFVGGTNAGIGQYTSPTFYIQGTGKLVFNGSTAQTMYGWGQVDEMVLNNSNGLSLINGAYSKMSIYKGLTLQSGTFTATQNTSMTLISNSPDTVAWLNDFGSNTGTYSGNLSVQRKAPSPGYNAQQNISSPVSGAAINSITGPYSWYNGGQLIPSSNCSEDSLSWQSPYSNGFSWNEANVSTTSPCFTTGWTAVGAGTYAPGVGYSVYLNSGSVNTLTGSPNTGDVNVTGLSNSGWTDVTPEGHTWTSGWSMLGNPYPSSIDVTSARSGFDAQVHEYQPSGAYKGTYVSLTISLGQVKLPAFQGVWVHKTSVGTGATWQWKKSERNTNVGPSYRFYKNGIDNMMHINIAGNGYQDQTVIVFNNDATNAFDVDYDAIKFHSDKGQPTLYTHNKTDEQWMGVNVMGALTQNTTVPMGVEPGANGQFTLTFSGIETFDAGTTVILEDKKLHSMTPIHAGDTYTFTAVKTDNWERFVIHFSVQQQSTSITSVKAEDIKVYSVENNLLVDFNKNDVVNASIEVYNILGQEILNDKYTGNGVYQHEMSEMTSGYAIVRVKMTNGEVVSKKLYFNNNK